MSDTLQAFENICDIDILRTNLSSIALFIGLYEHMIDTVEERVESFLCCDMHVDEGGQLRYRPSETYRQRIKSRIVDEKGNKNILKATMLWFVDEGAIDKSEYEMFLELKARRDSYVHQMNEHLWNGLTDDDAKALIDLYSLYIKIDKWWINEIEVPTTASEIPDDYDRDDVQSMAQIAFLMMLQTLYCGKSDEYKKMIDDIKKSNGDKQT